MPKYKCTVTTVSSFIVEAADEESAAEKAEDRACYPNGSEAIEVIGDIVTEEVP